MEVLKIQPDTENLEKPLKRKRPDGVLRDISNAATSRNLEKPHIDLKRTRLDDKDLLAAVEEKIESFDDDKKTIRDGDTIDIYKLLFTECRDYLARCNGPKVKAHELAGKVVVLYFVSLSTVVRSEPFETAHLLDAYNAIQHKPGLEVVLVVVEDLVDDYDPPSIEEPLDWVQKDPSWQFVEIFSRMPWAAIPYSDEASRERLRRKFDVHPPYDTPTSFIIDPAGCVLHCYRMDIFHNYGAEGFPFSHKRIASLCSQDNAAAEQLSLKRLLGSLKRDYVISNKEDRVPICNLEQKVVALYLYQYGLTKGITEELKMAYKTLEERSENFEVVLVNLYFTEYSYEIACEYTFWEAFKTMPWLALPFKSRNCRKVARIFNYPLLVGIEAREYKPTLVIIGPNGSFVERLGAEILMKYGSEAYPFTLEGAAKAEGKRVENLKLDSLLDPKVVLKGGNSPSRDVPIFQLNGKRILLFIEANWVRSIKTTEFLNMLEKSYNDKKGKGDEFEVIHVSCRREEDLYRKCVAGWPWLVHPFSKYFSYEDKLISPLFEGFPTRDRSALVAFDLDGRLVTKAFQLEFDVNEKNKEFPFAECLEIETLKEVTSAFKLYRPNPYEEDRDEDYGSYEDDEESEDEDPSDQDEDDEESEDEDPSDQDEDDDDPYNI